MVRLLYLPFAKSLVGHHMLLFVRNDARAVKSRNARVARVAVE